MTYLERNGLCIFRNPCSCGRTASSYLSYRAAVPSRIMAGGIYVGGKLWINDQDGGKLYYSSGRYEFDTRYVRPYITYRAG